jgi:hypothetical protein
MRAVARPDSECAGRGTAVCPFCNPKLGRLVRTDLQDSNRGIFFLILAFSRISQMKAYGTGHVYGKTRNMSVFFSERLEFNYFLSDWVLPDRRSKATRTAGAF